MSVTDFVELYVPLGGEADTVGGRLIVYVEVTIGLVFPRLSFAKNLSVVVELTVIPEMGLVPLALDVVGVEPSVV